jgi:hypothetical protein
MAVTITKLVGPTVKSGSGIEYTFSILLDSAYPAGGEPLDLTDYFTYVHGATVGSTDAVADNVYKYQCSIPSAGTAITSSNILLTAHYSNADEGVMVDATGADLSGVGELIVTVLGTSAVSTTW